MSTSEEERYGPLRSSEQQYRHDLATYGLLGEAEETAIIKRARSGDKAAQQALITSVLPPVERYAACYYWIHGWENERMEYADLVSVGNETLVVSLPSSLSKHNPSGYLINAAKTAIHQYATYSCYLTGRRRITTTEILEFVSLDQELGEGSSLADLLEEAPKAPEQASSLTQALSHALAQLPQDERNALGWRWGLVGYGKHYPAELERLYGLDADWLHYRSHVGKERLKSDPTLNRLLSLDQEPLVPPLRPSMRAVPSDCLREVPVGSVRARDFARAHHRNPRTFNTAISRGEIAATRVWNGRARELWFTPEQQAALVQKWQAKQEDAEVFTVCVEQVPAGSMRAVDFAALHGRNPRTFNTAISRGEIAVTRVLRGSARADLWLSPEQQATWYTLGVWKKRTEENDGST